MLFEQDDGTIVQLEQEIKTVKKQEEEGGSLELQEVPAVSSSSSMVQEDSSNILQEDGSSVVQVQQQEDGSVVQVTQDGTIIQVTKQLSLVALFSVWNHHWWCHKAGRQGAFHVTIWSVG